MTLTDQQRMGIIFSVLGPKCKEFDPTCMTCVAWQMQERLSEIEVELRLRNDCIGDLRKEINRITRGDVSPVIVTTLGDALTRIAMLERALRYYRDECTGYEPSVSVFDRMVDELIGPPPGL